MMSKKLSISLLSMAITISPVATLVACGNNKGDSNGPTANTVDIVYEKSWRPVFDKALAAMSAEEQKIIKLIQVEDGKGGDYLDTVKNKGAAAADVFAFAADRVSDLVSGQLLTEIAETDLPTGAATNKFVVQNGTKLYGYPLNVESVIQMYHNDTTGVDGFTSANGFDSIENAIASFSNTKFIYPFGNLWHGSALVNAVLAKEAHTGDTPADRNYSSSYATSLWINGTKPSIQAPKLYGNDDTYAGESDALWNETTGAMKKMHDYYTTLRGAGTVYPNIANNVNRDAEMRSKFQTKEIKGMIDGPWVINDIIARMLKATTDKTVDVASLNTFRAAKLPTYDGAQLNHFKGGWGYGINRLSTQGKTNQITLAKKFISEVTSNKYGLDWFKVGGKISATGAPTTVSAKDVEGLVLTDPTTIGATISLDGYTANTKSYIAEVYKSVINAVSSQAAMNVQQPSWDAAGLWEAFEAEGFSKSTNDTFTKLKTSMKTKIQNILTEANA